jgi:hypothetical protein
VVQLWHCCGDHAPATRDHILETSHHGEIFLVRDRGADELPVGLGPYTVAELVGARLRMRSWWSCGSP